MICASSQPVDDSKRVVRIVFSSLPLDTCERGDFQFAGFVLGVLCVGVGHGSG